MDIVPTADQRRNQSGRLLFPAGSGATCLLAAATSIPANESEITANATARRPGTLPGIEK
jgi:hypothetical protein